MRSLQIALLVFISLSLVSHNSDSLAAKGSKSSKSSSHRGKSLGRKGKIKADVGDVWARIRIGIRIPRPSPATEGLGGIPVLTSQKSSGLSSKLIKMTDANRDGRSRLTTVITPKKPPKGEFLSKDNLSLRQVLTSEKGGNVSKADLNSGLRYTPLGKLRFSKKLQDNSKPLTKDDSAFKSPSVQRIRTRLGLHPELFKNGEVPNDENIAKNSPKDKKSGAGSNPKNQQHAAIRSCADLKKDTIISLAQQGILAESFKQMAEECRIKQNEKVARVSKHIAGYGRGFLYQASEHARPYLYHIVDALSKYGLPMDIALLPIVESAYNPTALSSKSAAGIWQFIPSTGREYGMEQTDDYDARLDVTASTHAAIRFLSGLNAHFKGDWLLALAAYNCGQGAVDAAIARNQSEGLDTDFWSLDLPTETKEYVPRLLALATIFENPGSYGLKLRPLRNEPHFIKVNIDRESDINQLRNKDLKTVAKLANFDPEQFGLLNSAYRKLTIAQSKPFSLLMPISNANLLHQSLAFMAQSYKDESAEKHTFLTKLASAPESTIWKTQAPLLSISLNEDHKWLPSSKQPITFNVQPKLTDKQTDTSKPIADWGIHYLDKGETLKAVAEYHGISEGELREFNKFKRRQSISLGQRLLVPLKQLAATGMTPKKANPSSVLYKDIRGATTRLGLWL